MLGARIHRARVAAGLSLRGLAGRSGLSHTAIAKFEQSRLTPGSKTLLALARATGVKVEYFLRPETVELTRPEFRKRSSLGAKALQTIEVQILDHVERILEATFLFPEPPGRPFEVPTPLPPIRSLEEIEDVAEAVRAAWGLGQAPIASLTATLEEHGVLALTTPGDPAGRFDGLASRVGEIPLIVVGACWPGDRQRFTLGRNPTPRGRPGGRMQPLRRGSPRPASSRSCKAGPTPATPGTPGAARSQA